MSESVAKRIIVRAESKININMNRRHAFFVMGMPIFHAKKQNFHVTFSKNFFLTGDMYDFSCTNCILLADIQKLKNSLL